MHNRRSFVKAVVAGVLLPVVAKAEGLVEAKATSTAEVTAVSMNSAYQIKGLPVAEEEKMILPPALEKGSVIAIPSPASPTNLWEITSGVKAFERMGFKVEVGKIVKNQSNNYRYFSATDKDRTDELTEFINRDDVGAIVASRGGYGVMRILRDIDYSLIRKKPKIIMGFSDITALLNAVYRQSNMTTFHGPVASTGFDAFTTNQFLAMTTKGTFGKEFKISIPEMRTINQGNAIGRIQGGNLRMIASTMGTPYEIDTRDSILFLEDVAEHAYEIDRMLTQLTIAGKLDTCKAIAFGQFKNFSTRRPFYPNKGMTIQEVINDLIKPLGIPLVYNLPFGHVNSKLTLPIGINAELNTKNSTLTILEKPVA